MSYRANIKGGGVVKTLLITLCFLISLFPLISYAQTLAGQAIGQPAVVVVEGRVLATVPRLRLDQGRVFRDIVVFLETDGGKIEPAWYKAGEWDTSRVLEFAPIGKRVEIVRSAAEDISPLRLPKVLR